MEIVAVILGIINLIALVVVLILVARSRGGQDLSELTTEFAKFGQKFDTLSEKMVRVEGEVDKLTPKISGEFRESRKELTASFTLLMDTDDGSIEENTVKVFFDPTDTIYDVSARVKDMVQKNRKVETSGFAVKLASAVLKIPLLPNLVVGLVRLLDRYGLLPKAFLDGLPFHTSMFITNNASIGLMRVYHHIYNFGDTSMFISMGTPQRGYTVDAGGNVVRKCTLPIGVTVDERVCGGAVYAKLFAVMKNCLRHPEQLETPPEKVFYNKGCEFHVPKPENVFHPAAKPEDSVTA